MNFRSFIITLLIATIFNTFSNAQTWLWSNSLNSSSGIVTPMKTITNGDDIYTIAIFKENVDIDGQVYISKGNYDMLVIKYNKLGEYKWVKHYGSSGVDLIKGIIVYDNNIYITGSIGGNISFDGNPLSNVDGEDVFVACIGTNGSFNWSKR